MALKGFLIADWLDLTEIWNGSRAGECRTGSAAAEGSGLWGLSFPQFCHTDLFNADVFSSASFWSLTKLHAAGGVSDSLQGSFWGFLCPPQGEGSAERAGAADPGWLRGSLSFSRHKGKFSLSLSLPLKSATEDSSVWLVLDLVSFFL